MMNPNNFYYNYNQRPLPNKNGDRFIGGGFLAPFLLGGITGGILAPAFYPRPVYYPPMPYYYPRPYPVAYTQNQIYYN